MLYFHNSHDHFYNPRVKSALHSRLIQETSDLASLEKSADGTKELYLFFVLQASFLSVSASEICQQPPSECSVNPGNFQII